MLKSENQIEKCSDCNGTKQIILFSSIVDCEKCKTIDENKIKESSNLEQIKTEIGLNSWKDRDELRKELLKIRERQKKLQQEVKLKHVELTYDLQSDIINIASICLGITICPNNLLTKLENGPLRSFSARLRCFPCESCSDCKGTKKITLLNSIVDCEKCK